MPQVKPSVNLITYTTNPELTIATAAKLCYSSKSIAEISQGLEEGDTEKFIKKLMSMHHLSPLEHASFTFGIEGVSRSLLAQITRHRIASFSVKSQRYVSENKGFNYIVPPSIEALGPKAVEKFSLQMDMLQDFYNEWQEALGGASEVANQDARFVLPNAAETKMVVTMNARELLHFFELRCCDRAQWEIREVAWRMLELVSKVAPALFENAGPSCISTGKCSEGAKSCGKQKEMKERKEKVNK